MLMDRVIDVALAGLHRLVDLPALAVDPRAPELHRLRVRLVAEGVLPGARRRGVRQRLEHDLVEAAREAALEDRRHLEVHQRAAVLAVGRLVPALEELRRGPRVGLVGARPAGLREGHVLPHFLELRAQLEDALQEHELLVGLPGEGVGVRQGAHDVGVVRREVHGALVERDEPRAVAELGVGLGRGGDRCGSVGVGGERQSAQRLAAAASRWAMARSRRSRRNP